MLQPDISHDVHYVNPFFRPGGDTRRNAKRAVERAAKMQQEVEKIKRYYFPKGESVICPALPGPYTGRSGPRFWLADTGCRFDLIGETEISDEVLAGRKISDRAISLKTANSGVTANEVIPMSVPVIDENIEPLLLKSTPAAFCLDSCPLTCVAIRILRIMPHQVAYRICFRAQVHRPVQMNWSVSL